MKILIDINHPAHVHFFKNFIWEMQKRGHKIQVIASDKDIALQLLKEYNIPYVHIGSYGKSLLSKLLNLLWLDLKMMFVVIKYRPDILLGVASVRSAHAGFITGRRVYIFDDTEHAKTTIGLFKPFVEKIYTPDCFKTNLGPKQVLYPSCHELAYLHPNRFTPDKTVVNQLGLGENEKYFVIRFISWEAAHDVGQNGFSDKGKIHLVNMLLKHGKVIITSEGKLPPELEQYKIKVATHLIHHVLYYASMYVGDGGTMATEAAVLGTPCVFLSSLIAGIQPELSNKYKLLCYFTREEEALTAVENMLRQENLRKEWMEKRKAFLRDKNDLTAFMVNEIDQLSKG